MPNIRSAEKRARQNLQQRERNRRDRSRLRTALKKVRQAATADDARTSMLEAESLLDRLARRGIIHRNTAARHKERLQAHISTLP